MFSKVRSNTLFGIEARDVVVEVDVSKGIRAFSIVGMPDTAIRERVKRVTSALVNSGFQFPRKKITVNLAPAGIKKQGAFFDLPIALGILAADDEGLNRALSEKIICGELSLNGALKPLIGTLPRAIQVKAAGLKDFVLPASNAFEACLVNGLTPRPVRTLLEAVAWLKGEVEIDPPSLDPHKIWKGKHNCSIDFSDVKGQASIKRGLEVAAAGGHNMIMIGPPGSGKTMLARRFGTLLPDMTLDEAIESTKIHSATGRMPIRKTLLSERPFRAPHHSISSVGLVGGGSPVMPGEISLAHNGVVFLDELAEFRRDVIEILRQPIEDKQITIGRASGTFTFPADFIFIGAFNPCPCGNLSHPKKECYCTPPQIQRYLSKISGPLLDRIDIHLDVPPLDYNQLTSEEHSESSAVIRQRVEQAREVQGRRFNGGTARVNADLDGKGIRGFCMPDDAGKELLRMAIVELNLSARAYDKVLKIARTIADLEGVDGINKEHIAEAIGYRTLDRDIWTM